MFPIGTARPTTSPELESALTAGVHEVLRPASGRIRVTSDMRDGRIERLDLDLTGVTLTVPRSPDRPAPAGRASSARVGHLSLSAAPVVIDEVAVRAEADVDSLGVSFQPRGDGRLWLEPDDQAATDLTGYARVSAGLDDLEPVLLARLAPRVSATGFTLADVRLDATSQTPRRARLQVEATIRRGPLRAVVTGTATAEIGTDMVVRLSDLAVRSASPLVGMALGAVRGRLAQWEGQEVDLSAFTFGGARVRDVQLEVENRILTVRAEVGRS